MDENTDPKESPEADIHSNALLSDSNFLLEMSTYKLDHLPDGWPAIQQWKIDRLISLVYKMAGNDDGRLTQHILRNWPQIKIDRFAKHLLGDTCQKCESR